ncbi:hypothetical protein DAI22_08g053300 [Oryza sativa Japonica Group]|nr:hypothetical protein DAI22_08g053300 [Oryza sativa Japonica Group]
MKKLKTFTSHAFSVGKNIHVFDPWRSRKAGRKKSRKQKSQAKPKKMDMEMDVASGVWAPEGDEHERPQRLLLPLPPPPPIILLLLRRIRRPHRLPRRQRAPRRSRRPILRVPRRGGASVSRFPCRRRRRRWSHPSAAHATRQPHAHRRRR